VPENILVLTLKNTSFISKESSEIKCKNKCEEKINQAKSQASIKLKALVQKEKYFEAGAFQDENVFLIQDFIV
jgi:hypothetical protein